jgi:hypothetical protein
MYFASLIKKKKEKRKKKATIQRCFLWPTAV